MTEMRRKDRRVTDEALIDSILKECGVVRIGLYDEDRIYVVPVNYGYTYEDGRLSIYFHGEEADTGWTVFAGTRRQAL